MNISPLIDMVFILLIFYIVTAVLVKEVGLDVSKPEEGPGKDKVVVNLRVTARGDVFTDNVNIGISGVRAAVRNKMQRETLPVIIEVAFEVPAGTTVRVMDEVKSVKPDALISLAQARG